MVVRLIVAAGHHPVTTARRFRAVDAVVKLHRFRVGRRAGRVKIGNHGYLHQRETIAMAAELPLYLVSTRVTGWLTTLIKS